MESSEHAEPRVAIPSWDEKNWTCSEITINPTNCEIKVCLQLRCFSKKNKTKKKKKQKTQTQSRFIHWQLSPNPRFARQAPAHAPITLPIPNNPGQLRPMKRQKMASGRETPNTELPPEPAIPTPEGASSIPQPWTCASCPSIWDSLQCLSRRHRCVSSASNSPSRLLLRRRYNHTLPFSFTAYFPINTLCSPGLSNTERSFEVGSLPRAR